MQKIQHDRIDQQESGGSHASPKKRAVKGKTHIGICQKQRERKAKDRFQERKIADQRRDHTGRGNAHGNAGAILILRQRQFQQPLPRFFKRSSSSTKPFFINSLRIAVAHMRN